MYIRGNGMEQHVSWGYEIWQHSLIGHELDIMYPRDGATCTCIVGLQNRQFVSYGNETDMCQAWGYKMKRDVHINCEANMNRTVYDY